MARKVRAWLILLFFGNCKLWFPGYFKLYNLAFGRDKIVYAFGVVYEDRRRNAVEAAEGVYDVKPAVYLSGLIGVSERYAVNHSQASVGFAAVNLLFVHPEAYHFEHPVYPAFYFVHLGVLQAVRQHFALLYLSN